MTIEASGPALSEVDMVEAVIVSGPRHGERIHVNLPVQELLSEPGIEQLSRAIQGLDEALIALLQEAKELEEDLRGLRDA